MKKAAFSSTTHVDNHPRATPSQTQFSDSSRSLRSLIPSCVVLVLVAMNATTRAAESSPRRPIAIVISADGKTGFAANREPGTISVFDTSTGEIADEVAVGAKLSGMVAASERRLLVLDAKNHQLITVDASEGGWGVTARDNLSEHPVQIVFDAKQQRCYVSSLWSRSVTAFEVHTDSKSPRKIGTVSLPFAPREMCLVEQGTLLIVAGAFDANLAVIETANETSLLSVKSLVGHNIRGMTPANGQLHISLQTLSPLAHSSRDDVHWGNMISNQLASIPLAKVLDPTAISLEKHQRTTRLGEPGDAAGDPGAIAVGRSGRLFVLLSGVGEVAIGTSSTTTQFQRLKLSSRPVAMAVHGDLLFVANMFSDSISVVDATDATQRDRFSLGTHRPLSQVEQGEVLFYDSRVSLDGWMSCHSCHTDGHTNEQLNDNLSDGSFGAARRVLSLLGSANTGPWAWNGSSNSLEQQIINSVENTMRGQPLSKEQVSSLVAYVKSLEVPNASIPVNPALADRGAKVFTSLACGNCHQPPSFTSPKTYPVGLADQLGNDHFNPPSLRGVRLRSNFFHDARAHSLIDVFSVHRHQLTDAVSETDILALVAYLQTL